METKANRRLTTNEKWCKGCGICVAFCPQGVLKLVGGKSVPVELAKCTKCGLCEMRCPDYAIWLEEAERGRVGEGAVKDG